MASADEELGYAYLPTATPTHNWYGGHRPGDNLFPETLLCQECDTGRRVWHYQLIHHDLRGYDTTSTPILADITVEGRPVKAVVRVTRQAFAYVFDHMTGETVRRIEERPVPQSDVPGERTSPTQVLPDPARAVRPAGVPVDDLIGFTPVLRAEALELLNRSRRAVGDRRVFAVLVLRPRLAASSSRPGSAVLAAICRR